MERKHMGNGGAMTTPQGGFTLPRYRGRGALSIVFYYLTRPDLERRQHPRRRELRTTVPRLIDNRAIVS